MVQPGKNPSPGEPFHDQNASDRSDGGLEGVVEELRNVLSGLGNDAVEQTAPVEEQQPAPKDKHFPFSPVIESPDELPPVPEPERGPLQEAPPPSDADFWNGNVLGWSDKAPDAPPTELNDSIAPLEPISEPEPELESFSEPEPVKPSRPSVEDLLPPLPPSPFDAVETPPSPPPPPPPIPVAIEVPVTVPEPVEKAVFEKAPPMEPRLPVDIMAPPPAAEPPPVKPLDLPVPSTDEKPAMIEVQMEKPEGLIQIACIYPKGFEKQGQHFVTTLRSACSAAKLKIVIQPVYIQPWSSDKIDVPGWADAARLAGADRMFVMASKKEQDQFKNVAGEGASKGVASRLILLEHVGLRTLYADILVELRRP